MFEHIRGDTFALTGEVHVTVNGQRQLDLTGYQGRSQVRDTRGQLVAELGFAWLDASLSLVALTAPGSTAEWPVGGADMDIQFTAPSGDVVSTQRTRFQIIADVTR